MRLNGAAALISVLAVSAVLAATVSVAGPVATDIDGVRMSGPTHPIEPGGKGRGGETPVVVRG